MKFNLLSPRKKLAKKDHIPSSPLRASLAAATLAAAADPFSNHNQSTLSPPALPPKSPFDGARTPSPRIADKPLPLPKITTNGGSSSDISSYYSTPSSQGNAPEEIGEKPRLSPLKTQMTGSSSFSSPHRRVLSDKVRTTPSSLVRHSRVYSQSNLDTSDPSIQSLLNGKASLLLQNKLDIADLSPELAPIVTLLNAQRLRTYKVGQFQIPSLYQGDRVWLEVDAKISGNELAIWRPSGEEYIIGHGNDEFKPKYINLIDSKIEIGKSGTDEIKIYQDYKDESVLVIKFHNKSELKEWFAAIQLSKFEYTSLNEAFTAAILSSKGSKLSDIHILLSHKKRYPQSEWCNLRLPQVSSKWLKVFVIIIPGESKKLGRIEIYQSDKVSKKNLIAYISSVADIYNVYPEQANMIDFNAIMKVDGDIYINKNFEYLFATSFELPSDHRSFAFKSISRNNSSNSLSSMGQNRPGSRNISNSSTTSFFHNASEIASSSPPQTRQRSLSQNSQHSVDTEPKRVSSFLKKNLQSFVTTNYLYLMPISHPGVSAVETMIRNFLPIIDAFKLYGRPEHLISDKTNINSMLFGLPSLPHYQYLSTSDSIALVNEKFLVGMQENWQEYDWRNEFKGLLLHQILSTENFRGHGSILRLYDALDVDFGEISSPRINLPTTTLATPTYPSGEVFDSFSDNVSSPVDSISNDTALGAAIDLPSERYAYQAVPNGNLRLNAEDLNNFNFVNNFQDRSLEPIVDMPTPIDEAQPYKNLISLSLNDK